MHTRIKHINAHPFIQCFMSTWQVVHHIHFSRASSFTHTHRATHRGCRNSNLKHSCHPSYCNRNNEQFRFFCCSSHANWPSGCQHTCITRFTLHTHTLVLAIKGPNSNLFNSCQLRCCYRNRTQMHIFSCYNHLIPHTGNTHTCMTRFSMHIAIGYMPIMVRIALLHIHVICHISFKGGHKCASFDVSIIKIDPRVTNIHASHGSRFSLENSTCRGGSKCPYVGFMFTVILQYKQHSNALLLMYLTWESAHGSPTYMHHSVHVFSLHWPHTLGGQNDHISVSSPPSYCKANSTQMHVFWCIYHANRPTGRQHACITRLTFRWIITSTHWTSKFESVTFMSTAILHSKEDTNARLLM